MSHCPGRQPTRTRGLGPPGGYRRNRAVPYPRSPPVTGSTCRPRLWWPGEAAAPHPRELPAPDAQRGPTTHGPSPLIDRVLRAATGARAALALIALGVGGGLLFRLSPYDALKARLNGGALPEETITSPDRFAAVLDALGDPGRELYLRFQLWDVLNPVLIGVAGALVLGWLLGRAGRSDSAWRYVLLFPFVLLGADLAENVVISLGIGAFPAPAAVAGFLPWVTATKFGAAAGMAGSMVLVGILLLWNRVSGAPRPAA